jgi:hypothetical protein
LLRADGTAANLPPFSPTNPDRGDSLYFTAP